MPVHGFYQEREVDKMRGSKGVLFVVFLLFGMIITMQFRTILLAQQQNNTGQTSVQALASELEQAKMRVSNCWKSFRGWKRKKMK